MIVNLRRHDFVIDDFKKLLENMCAFCSFKQDSRQDAPVFINYYDHNNTDSKLSIISLLHHSKEKGLNRDLNSQWKLEIKLFNITNVSHLLVTTYG